MSTRKKVLLLGASGFIGRNIKESYLSEKYEIDGPSSKELNLLDDQSVSDYFKNRNYDFVIHSAIKPGHRNAKDPTAQLFSSTRMFFNLIKHEDKWERMLFIGSGAIYDANNYQPRMKEDYFGVNIPRDEHGFAKYIIRKYIEKTQGRIVDLVVFSIFGKYEDYAIRFISNMMCKALHGLPMTMNRNRRFDFLYVNDLIPVVDFFLQNVPQHSSYNVTPDETVYLLDMAQRIREMSGKDLPIIIKNENGLDLEYSGDNLRLKSVMSNYKPTPFEKSLPELYDWYSKNLNLIDRNLLLFDK